jgi:hypothetical protein
MENYRATETKSTLKYAAATLLQFYEDILMMVPIMHCRKVTAGCN